MNTKRIRPMIELVCAATGETFLKDQSEHKRQIREGATRFFKDRETATRFLSAEATAKTLVMKECRHCGKPFSSSNAKKARVCCSRQCAARCSHETMAQNPDLVSDLRRRQSEASKRHYQLVLAGERPRQRYWNGKRSASPSAPKCHVPPTIEELTRVCTICEKSFVVDNRTKHPKTCSKECRRVHSSRTSSANPNCGGETNYRRYRYNEVLMDSQWEVDIAIWLDENKIVWRRDRKMTFRWTDPEGTRRRYHPDFYLPAYDVYLDPKNKYLIEKDRFKIEAVMKEHDIKIIWGLKEDVFIGLRSLIDPPIS